MTMGHIERGVDAAFDINKLCELHPTTIKPAYDAILPILATLEGCSQDVFTDPSEVINDYCTDLSIVDDEDPEDQIAEAANRLTNFRNLVKQKTGLLINCVRANGDHMDCYDDVERDSWVWFCENAYTAPRLTKAARIATSQGIVFKSSRWSDFG